MIIFEAAEADFALPILYAHLAKAFSLPQARPCVRASSPELKAQSKGA